MREMICLVCPVSCRMEVEKVGEQVLVQGNRCPRGKDFATREMTRPMRTLTTTVKTDSSAFPRLPVKLSGPVPRNRLFDVMAIIHEIRVKAPVQRGQVLIADILDLGLDLIASSGLLSGEDDG